MEIIHRICCGLDVHKKLVTACLIVDGKREIRTFGRTKGNYLSTMYHRLAARKGAKKATVAVAHALLVIIYHMLKDGTRHHDLGRNYYDERDKQMVVKRTVKRLEALGYKVTVEPAASVA